MSSLPGGLFSTQDLLIVLSELPFAEMDSAVGNLNPGNDHGLLRPFPETLVFNRH